MTRDLGSELLADLSAPAAERCQLLKFDFADSGNNPTPVYLTNAGVDIDWDGHTWEAAGPLSIDAMGESADGAANGLRVRLSGVKQTILGVIMNARWRGRNATIYHAGFNRTTGAILSKPKVMFVGPMNGGFQIGESRGGFGGGKVEINSRLTSRIDELVKVRGVRTNEASHRTTIPGATTDTFFQNVPSLMNRPSYWGVKMPAPGKPVDSSPTGPVTQSPPGIPPWGGPPPGQSPWPGVTPPPPAPTPNMDPGRT